MKQSNNLTIKSLQSTLNKSFVALLIILSLTYPFPALAGPASSNYQLKSYGFGAGGTDNASSSNYKMHGTAGEIEFGQQSSANYKTNGGLTYELMSDVPPAPTITNPSNYYNKLHIVINRGSDTANDVVYGIAISPDGFSTTTNYIRTDHTINNTFSLSDWQSYASWGGASGFDVIGLTPGTTYTIKIAARKGNFTQSGYSKTASAATVSPSFTLSISPSTVDFGVLSANSVNNSPTVTINVDTNANYGGYVYMYGTNAGLKSTHSAYTINSMTANLAGQTEGYGGQITAASATSGSLAISSPYDGTGSTVGIIDTTIRNILSSSAPVTGGSSTLLLKAKTSSTTPAANDYTETLTVIGSGTF